MDYRASLVDWKSSNGLSSEYAKGAVLVAGDAGEVDVKSNPPPLWGSVSPPGRSTRVGGGQE